MLLPLSTNKELNDVDDYQKICWNAVLMVKSQYFTNLILLGDRETDTKTSSNRKYCTLLQKWYQWCFWSGGGSISLHRIAYLFINCFYKESKIIIRLQVDKFFSSQQDIFVGQDFTHICIYNKRRKQLVSQGHFDQNTVGDKKKQIYIAFTLDLVN